MNLNEQYEPNLVGNPDLSEKVRTASAVLHEVLERSEVSVGNGDNVRAEWGLDRFKDGRQKVRLRLADPPATVEAWFSPEELEQRGELAKNLSWLWGNLMLRRAQLLIREAKALAMAEEGSP
jgi:hypothetical protein